MSDVTLLPIAIGRHVNLKELQKINDGHEVPMFGEYEDPEKVGKKIIQGAYMQQTELVPGYIITPGKFENETITGYFGFVPEENLDREIAQVSQLHPFI